MLERSSNKNSGYRTDPPGVSASERIEIEISISDDAERPTKDAEENDEDDNPPLVSNGPPASSSAHVESSTGQRAASPHVATLSEHAKSFARHWSAAAPDVAMHDERAAVASFIVPDDKPEPSGRRAKSLTPQRRSRPSSLVLPTSLLCFRKRHRNRRMPPRRALSRGGTGWRPSARTRRVGPTTTAAMTFP